MKKLGIVLIFVVLAVVPVVAGLRSNPAGVPADQKQLDFQAYYEARVQYVGNNAEMRNLLDALNMSRFGRYTIALETDQEPYGFIINFSDINITGDLLDYREKGLADEAYYILALVENLNYVEVRFKEYTYRLTEKEANAFIRGNIKDYGQTPQQLEALHGLLNAGK